MVLEEGSVVLHVSLHLGLELANGGSDLTEEVSPDGSIGGGSLLDGGCVRVYVLSDVARGHILDPEVTSAGTHAVFIHVEGLLSGRVEAEAPASHVAVLIHHGVPVELHLGIAHGHHGLPEVYDHLSNEPCVGLRDVFLERLHSALNDLILGGLQGQNVLDQPRKRGLVHLHLPTQHISGSRFVSGVAGIGSGIGGRVGSFLNQVIPASFPGEQIGFSLIRQVHLRAIKPLVPEPLID
eukprot:CAMPEP_0170542828 /NCGR_PEP_ID=MMETSP0211-20121228/2137_1 /TAXON_ID=311385 /ORGANISM="Pseudokeronopsis sp., Strain OXSARD2" /LENGTH=237 /DNA_ID=CAMNT_0010846019 /DNA_START=250 /DNA_END=963 /DNA_ORIENTATION=+